MDDKLKEHFDALSNDAKIEALIHYMDEIRDLTFENAQLLQHFHKHMSEDELLQRKEVWSKKEVCRYFDFDAKSFERYKKSGELKVKSIGGKDYCLLTDLKDRFRDRGE